MSINDLDQVEAELRKPELAVRDLHAIWERRQPIPDPQKQKAGTSARDVRQIPWLQEDLSLAGRFTRHALAKEEFLLVCDAAEEALRLWPNATNEERALLMDVRMTYAAALTRLGCTSKARGLLEPCVGADPVLRLGRKRKVDVLLQLGDILREESQQSATAAERRHQAEEALRFYQQALTLEPDRLEALTLSAAASLVLGAPGSALREQARDLARRALTLAAEIEDADQPQLRTIHARAVAHAIDGQPERASEVFRELAEDGIASVAQLANTRYYARFLAEALGLDPDFFKPAFPPLQLIVFAGHLPDRPDGNGHLRFPPEAVPAVRDLLEKKLRTMDARVGLVNASAGGDLLFIDTLLARKGTVHLLLPWSREEFRRTSIRPFDPAGQTPRWEGLFDRALKEAATLREIGQAYEPSSEVGWQYMMEVTAGLALHTARIARLDVQPLVLWDRQRGRGAGGTGSFEEFWRCRLGQKSEVVELPAPAIHLDGGGQRDHSQRSERSTLRQEVKSMLFADIVGYSKLSELVIPEFVSVFLESVSRLAANSPHAPRHVNTWGDAVYAVFDFARDAGCFALELTQMIQDGEATWKKTGLYWEEPGEDGQPARQHPLNIRIGLHTGPVFMHYNPVVRQLGFTGVHVNRAARIEPVAAHGEVFASEEFAALAALGNEMHRHAGPAEAGSVPAGDTADFVCEYAGSMSLAKGYPGRFRIYRVLPKRVFALEELARTIHAAYCKEAEARGETPATNPSLVPWDRLPEELRRANLAQAGDIPNKLRALGYELTPGHGLLPAEIHIGDARLETLAIREHDRWADERRQQGWTYGPERDNARKQNPLLVPWEALDEVQKEKDRHAVRNLPKLVEQAKFRVRPLAAAR